MDPIPEWWQTYEDSRHLPHMSIRDVLAWRETADGTWYLARLRVGWLLEAWAQELCASRAPQKSEAQWQAEGWRGGRVSAEDMAACAIFDDEGEAAA